MRCKSCDAELSAMDLQRKNPVDDSFMDLCTACYGASERHLYEVIVEAEEVALMQSAAPQRTPQAIFAAFVEKHDLRASWADGLGLRWTPEERVRHFYNKCFDEYVELAEAGFGTMRSLERACGIHRADRRREYSGASYAQTEGSVASGMADTAITDWLGGEIVTN